MEHNVESIRNKIYEIRGQRVMLDFDLAELYGVETRALNQAVKRNIERFPEDFMFQLTKGELEILTNQILRSEKVSENTENISKGSNLISQIVISRFLDKRETKHDKGWGGSRKLPYAFTENGVAMLSSVLRSSLAIQINIGIMRTFTEFRKIATSLNSPIMLPMWYSYARTLKS